MAAYLALKHLHVSCVIISIAGFFLRGLLMLADSPRLQQRWLRVVPHINDSVLLAAAVTLAVLIEQYPLTHGWLTAKLFGLIAYIILGSLALKPGRGKVPRLAAWLGALVAVFYVVSVALTKNPAGFLAWG